MRNQIYSGRRIVRSGQPELQADAFEHVAEFIREKVMSSRCSKPGKAIFSAIVHAKFVDGRAITEAEIIEVRGLLIAAGLDCYLPVTWKIARPDK